MGTASAEIAVGFTGYAGLSFRDGLDPNPRCPQEIVEAAAGNGVTAGVDDGGGLDVVGGGDTPDDGVRDRLRVRHSIWLVAQYGDQCRGIDNHFGRPFSS